ncbi:MAG: IS481 family transposase, partial [Parcubacteria group bacterium CG_4_10_14_0_8_um_filter_35_7]
MCSGSERKLKDWNEELFKYNIEVYDTGGIKWKQNLIERTHRTDDEEFYCPRGEFIQTKNDFLVE